MPSRNNASRHAYEHADTRSKQAHSADQLYGGPSSQTLSVRIHRQYQRTAKYRAPTDASGRRASGFTRRDGELRTGCRRSNRPPRLPAS